MKDLIVKPGYWFGAGFNVLLLFMLATILWPSFNGSSLFPGLPLVNMHDLPVLILFVLVALCGGIWFVLLRIFTRSLPGRKDTEGRIVISAAFLGLSLAGILAWLRWIASDDSSVEPLLVGLTLIGALILQLVSVVQSRSDLTLTRQQAAPDEIEKGTLRDYIMLTKPIVLALLLVTTIAAMIIAAGEMPDLGLMAWTMLGGAFSAGGASALNQYIDRIGDGKMARTKSRPLPEGRLHPHSVILFGIWLCIAGFYTLAIFVNLLSALLALAGMIYYVIFYSLMLKPTTVHNIVIGGGAGAIPPLVGWAAAVGELSMPAFFLFALVFFWTPPHFWALALLKRRDYARAGVPMLPVIYGPQETRGQIMLYTVQVVALTLLLPLAKLGGQIYFIAALLLGGGLVFYAWRLWRRGGNQSAYKMYRYSSTYLALLFVVLVVDTFL